ncbi:MAG: Mobile element protein, partial [Olavius algarvensis Gamma 1 endosymbiont]
GNLWGVLHRERDDRGPSPFGLRVQEAQVRTRQSRPGS